MANDIINLGVRDNAPDSLSDNTRARLWLQLVGSSVELFGRGDGEPFKLSGGNIATGTSFPNSPATGMLFVFVAVATGLANYQNINNSTRTTAEPGDVAYYDGSVWRYLGASAISVDDIPNLPASKITSGEFNSDRIPNLDADKVNSGTLDPARIPNLSAEKITSGTLNQSRIPFPAPRQFESDETRHIITRETANFDLAPADSGKLIYVSNQFESIVTLPSSLPDGFYCRIYKTNASSDVVNVQGTLLYEQGAWCDVEKVDGELEISAVYNSQSDWNVSSDSNRSGIKNKPSNVVTGVSLSGNDLRFTRHNENSNQVIDLLESLPSSIARSSVMDMGDPFADIPNVVKGEAINLQPLYSTGLGETTDYTLNAGQLLVNNANVILSKDTSSNAQFDRFIDISQVPVGTEIRLAIDAGLGQSTQAANIQARLAPASGTTGSTDPIARDIKGGVVNFAIARESASHTRLWIQGNVTSQVGSRLRINSITITTDPSYPTGSAYASQGFIQMTFEHESVVARIVLAKDGSQAIKIGTADWIESPAHREEIIFNPDSPAISGINTLNAGKSFGDYDAIQVCFRVGSLNCLFRTATVATFASPRNITEAASHASVEHECKIIRVTDNSFLVQSNKSDATSTDDLGVSEIRGIIY